VLHCVKLACDLLVTYMKTVLATFNKGKIEMPNSCGIKVKKCDV